MDGDTMSSPEFQAREKKLLEQNAALVEDFAAKCHQFMELQLKYDDSLSTVEELQHSNGALKHELEKEREKQSKERGGTALKELVLQRTLARLHALEVENQTAVRHRKKLKKVVKRLVADNAQLGADLEDVKSRLRHAKRELRKLRSRRKKQGKRTRAAPDAKSSSAAGAAREEQSQPQASEQRAEPTPAYIIGVGSMDRLDFPEGAQGADESPASGGDVSVSTPLTTSPLTSGGSSQAQDGSPQTDTMN